MGRERELYFSLLLNKCDKRALMKSQTLMETVSGLRFRISPDAFFQSEQTHTNCWCPVR
jgi:hypothetical protein